MAAKSYTSEVYGTPLIGDTIEIGRASCRERV